MEYRQLGASGLKVSAITMGTMTFGGGRDFAAIGNTGTQDAREQIHLCLDAGVNLIDTANIYSDGVSEEIIGEVLGGTRPADFLLATKVRFNMGPGPNDGWVSRYHIVRQCEASLKRMKTEVIDLYQVHQWDGLTPPDETLGALDSLVRHGKVRYIGCSSSSAWHLMKALGISANQCRQRFVSQQIYYSLEAREVEYELIPISLDQGLGVLVWSPLARGLLSGKYRRDKAAPEGTRQLADWVEPPIRDEERLWRIVDEIVPIAERRGISGAQVSLAWLLGRAGVTSVVIGGCTTAQFRDNLAAVNLVLTREERAQLDSVSAPPLLYPYWHHAMTASDRLGRADLSLLGPHL